MKFTLLYLVVIVLLLSLCEAKGGRGGGGRGGGGGGRGGRGGRAGRTSTGGIGRSTSWGTGGYYSIGGRPRSALYKKNYLGFRGKSSVNSNGFGMGLGAGLSLGFGMGMLARPRGYNDPTYTFEREHDLQKYNKREDGRLYCARAGNVFYVKKKHHNQDVETEEGYKFCEADEDMCYGFVEITEANVVLTSGKKEELLEVKVSKGCWKKAEFDKWTQTGSSSRSNLYNPSRYCFTSDAINVDVPITEKGKVRLGQDRVPILGVFKNTTSLFDFVKTNGLQQELRLDSPLSSSNPLKYQAELCVCDQGDLCNGGPNLMATSTASLFLVCLVMNLLA